MSCYVRIHPDSATTLERIAQQAARRVGVADHRLLLWRTLAAMPAAVRSTVSTCARSAWSHRHVVRLRAASTAVTLPVKLKLLLSFYQILDTVLVKEGLHMTMAGTAPDMAMGGPLAAEAIQR